MRRKSIAVKSPSVSCGCAPSTISARNHLPRKRALTTRRNLRWRSAKRLATSRLCLRVRRCVPARPDEFPAGQTISFEACRTFSRNDDAGLVAGNFRRCGITAAHVLEECPRLRAAVGLLFSEAQQQHEDVEHLRIFCRWKTRALRSPLFYFGKKPGQIVIK